VEKNEDVVGHLYDYNQQVDGGNGYKSPEAFLSSPYTEGDTWEAFEKTEGLVDYLLGNYDGIVLLEGGHVTFLLDNKFVESFTL
jgi:hypothetical protein